MLVKSVDDTEAASILMLLTDVTEMLETAEHLRRLCYHDKLTALYNRSYIEAMLPYLEKAENLPLSVIMLDMNGLKLVNDVFGHEQGDRLLVAMAKTLVKSCRKTDILGRWGGDEFLVLLPRTGKEACAEVCARIRRSCGEMANMPLLLSAAMGTVTKENGVAGLAELFIVAENRMYKNKVSESQTVRRSIIASIESMLHERCFQNAGHVKRVRQMAADFAVYLGYSRDDPKLKLLNKLAALHDVGKVAIPKEILPALQHMLLISLR
jgi:diguanylate cyclase (GGDEF)-like protein